MKQIVSELFIYMYCVQRSVENLESKTSKHVEMINFLEQYHEASHLQERPNVDGKSV